MISPLPANSDRSSTAAYATASTTGGRLLERYILDEITTFCHRSPHWRRRAKALFLRLPIPLSQPADATDELAHRQAACYVRALLLARIYEVLPLLWPRCGGAMRIIAFITEAAVIRAVPCHLGEPKQAPRPRPARGPPLWEMPGRGSGAINPQTQPMPGRVSGACRGRLRCQIND